MSRLLTLAWGLTAAIVPCAAQSRLVAYVPTAEASTTGALMTAGDKSMLGEKSAVSAAVRPAHVTLSRGGMMLVCQASVVHLTAGQGVFNPKSKENFDPLLIALESGALELQMPAIPSDTIATGGMRLTSVGSPNKSVPLEIALRVSSNGDTCVENRGRKSTLTVTDSFGQASFQLKAGQHVLFQHGLIQEARTGGTSFCGCPPAPPPMSLADAVLRAGPAAPTFTQSASAYPFPEADSAGIQSFGTAPPPERPVQVAANLTFNGETDSLSTPAATASSPSDSSLSSTPERATPEPASPPEPPPLPTPDPPAPTTGRRKLLVPPPQKTEAAASRPPIPDPPKPTQPAASAKQEPKHSLGHFFKKIFGGT
jgi:hypothetical protein